jgi:3-deoxy-D-manno-octulosonic-acid transferase
VRLFYGLLYTLAFVVALPVFLILGLLRGKYFVSARQRFGFIPHRSSRPSCWIHAVSVGEFLAAKPVIRGIQQRYPDLPLYISTTTITGNKLAADFLPEQTFFFPFDWSWTVGRVLARLRPCLILVLETEIWPNLLWQAQDRGIPVVLVNGRLSDGSYSRYRFVKRWLPAFRESWMQTAEDAKRMKLLTGQEAEVMGNLKFDFQPTALESTFRQSLRSWKGDSLLWVCGSTMPGEEEELLDVYAVVAGRARVKLLLAPRHPQRFEEVARRMSARGLSFVRRSQEGFEPEASVLLLDTIGELAGCYEFADVVFVGGTLSDCGGHNPIEPAYFGKPVVVGPHYQNFRAVFADLIARQAVTVTRDLTGDILRLLEDEARRKRMGLAAGSLVKENSGATEFVIQRIEKYIHDRDSVESDSKLPV